jgi:hypothetical protein
VCVSILLPRFRHRFRNNRCTAVKVCRIDLAVEMGYDVVRARLLIENPAVSSIKRASGSDLAGGRNQDSKGTKGQVDKGSSGVL